MNRENQTLDTDILLISDFLPEYSKLTLEEINKNFNEVNIIGTFAYCIKRVRKTKNITQKELGKLTGISENTIYNYENGKTKPTKLNKEKILNFLDISELTMHTINKSLDEFNKLKEFNKYKTEKENEEISNIVDEIKRINSQSLYFIVDFIIKNRFLELEELKKVIKGFKMLKSNDNFIIAHSSNLNSNNNIKIELLKNGGSNVTFNIENFITDVLIELSETIDNIFYRKKRIEEKSILSYETEKVKIKQYEKINNLLNNKEGGSNE